MPAHQLLKSPSRRSGPAVVSSSTVPSIESIYALVGKPTPSPPSTYSPADITAKRKEEYRRKQEKDEEGLGTASAFSSGNLDAYGQGIISGHSSGINIKARAKAFGEGRSSPKVERSPPEQQQKQQKQQRSPEIQLPRSVAERSSNMPSIGILPGGGNSDYPAVYSGTPASQKRHYNQYDEEVLEGKSASSDSIGVNREMYGSLVDPDTDYSVSKGFSSPNARGSTKDEPTPTATTSPASNVSPSRISASKRAEDARKEYVRELEAQVSEQRKRKEAEKAYRMSPGWTGSNFSQNAIMSPSNGGIAELLGSSNGYFSVDSRSPGVGPSNNKSPQAQHHQQHFSSSSSPSSMNSSPRPFLRLDPLPEGVGEGIIPSNSAVEGPWTPRSPQRQSSLVTEGGGGGIHSYSPKWLAQQAAELEADASIGRGGNGGGRMTTTNVIGIKSPGGQSSTSTATTRDRLLREQVNRLTEKFDITLDALQQYADRFGPLD